MVRGRTHERNFGIDGRGRSKFSNKDKVCCYCKKMGNTKTECYKFQIKNKRATANQNRKLLEKPSQASVVEDGYSDGKLLVSSNYSTKSCDKWILDSGCTFYLCPNRDFFLDL